MRIECASASQCGTHTLVNQDAVFCKELSSGESKLAVAAVFDGHGLLGEAAASESVRALPRAVMEAGAWTTEPEECMRRVIRSLHAAVVEAHTPCRLPAMHEHGYGTHVLTYSLASDGSAYESSSSSALGGGRSSAHPVDFGCTAAVAVLVCQSRMLVAGNAGDSIVLLCSASDYDLGISSLSRSTQQTRTTRHAVSSPRTARRASSMAISKPSGGPCAGTVCSPHEGWAILCGPPTESLQSHMSPR